MEKSSTKITLYNLPKISLNEWYSGKHWIKRVKIKEKYKWIIKSQFKHVFKANMQYSVEYVFEFKIKPLDASNCVAMVKLIEDIIFEDDKYNIVVELKISSHKSTEEKVIIIINENS